MQEFIALKSYEIFTPKLETDTTETDKKLDKIITRTKTFKIVMINLIMINLCLLDS